MKDADDLLILNAIPGMGNAKISTLIELMGNARNVLHANKKQFLSTGIMSEKIIESIMNFPKDDFLKKEWSSIEKKGVKVITYLDEEYPVILKEIPDSPVVLYVKGDLRKDEKLSLAIVGSRKASIYGINMAQKFAMELSEFGFAIVSGMARGVDTAAHKGALMSGGRTIAVLGSGLDQIYPKENLKMFEEISKKGCILSEFPMDTNPLAYNFPRRNRIISGLSLGVIVVEAARKSGSLITARMALEQGRDVFAVPGKIDCPTSRGVNNLIKQGAKLITGIEDVLEDMDVQIRSVLMELAPSLKSESEKEILNDLTEQERLVYNYIDNYINFDDVISKTLLDSSCVSTVLFKLELKGLIRHVAGKGFEKV